MSVNRYIKSVQDTQGPLEIVVSSYNLILNSLAMAQDLNNPADKISQSEHAKEGIFLLLTSLDMKQGEISNNLCGIYKYIIGRLSDDFFDIDADKQNARLQESYDLISKILEGWRKI